MRLVTRVPGMLTLHDIYHDGRILLGRDTPREGMIYVPETGHEHDLSWFVFSTLSDCSADGSMALFTETGEGGGTSYAVYLRTTDGSPAVRLGDGSAMSLSPDGNWAAAARLGDQQPITLLPTGAGTPRDLPQDGSTHLAALWLHDGKRIVFTGNEPNRGVRLYVVSASDGKPRAISPEGVSWNSFAVSFDDRHVAGVGSDRKAYLYPIEGGEAKLIPQTRPGENIISFSQDGGSLFLYNYRELPAQVWRVDIASGKRTPFKQLFPADAAGINHIAPVLMSRDGKKFIYGYARFLSDVYL